MSVAADADADTTSSPEASNDWRRYSSVSPFLNEPAVTTYKDPMTINRQRVRIWLKIIFALDFEDDDDSVVVVLMMMNSFSFFNRIMGNAGSNWFMLWLYSNQNTRYGLVLLGRRMTENKWPIGGTGRFGPSRTGCDLWQVGSYNIFCQTSMPIPVSWTMTVWRNPVTLL